LWWGGGGALPQGRKIETTVVANTIEEGKDGEAKTTSGLCSWNKD
jgi:hypothetical protein